MTWPHPNKTTLSDTRLMRQQVRLHLCVVGPELVAPAPHAQAVGKDMH